MNNKTWPHGISLALVGLLVACGQQGSPFPKPTVATINGVTKIDRATGSAQLSVSALDKDSQLLKGGNISDVRVITVRSATWGGDASTIQSTYSATSSVCGNIQNTGGSTSAILMLDASGSMADTDPSRLRAVAAKQYVDRMGATDLAAVGSFSNSVSLPAANALTSDKTALKAAVDTNTRAAGGTNLWAATFDSTNYIGTATGTNRIAVVFTDGEDNFGSRTTQQVIANATGKGVKIYMIGLGSSINPNQMVSVAQGTGGLYNAVSDASGLNSLFNGVFNAAQSAGCIELKFNPAPPANTTLQGQVEFKVEGTPLQAPFTIRF